MMCHMASCGLGKRLHAVLDLLNTFIVARDLLSNMACCFLLFALPASSSSVRRQHKSGAMFFVFLVNPRCNPVAGGLDHGGAALFGFRKGRLQLLNLAFLPVWVARRGNRDVTDGHKKEQSRTHHRASAVHSFRTQKTVWTVSGKDEKPWSK